MTQDEIKPDAGQADTFDESLIDDVKPVGNRLRFLLIALSVGMVLGGIYWNYHRAKVLKDRRESRKPDPSAVGPRYVDPPPADAYPWVKGYDVANSIAARIPPPPGAIRTQVAPDSFANWIRYLPVKAGEQKVTLHTGQPRQNQHAHCAVLDVDVGPENLQQAAQAVLRLRAEYLFARNDFDAIQFHITPSQTVSWNQWRKGDRPTMKGGKIVWKSGVDKADDSYANFRKFLNTLFAQTDTKSLAVDMEPLAGAEIPKIGDVFLHPGKPGHAVIVVDMVEDIRSGQKAFLLAQSFIPAQDMHILVNAYDPQRQPWYTTDYREKLQTPEWTFQATELRRFP